MNSTVVTLGTFDGVHLGHQAIFIKLNEIAATKKLTPVALTFDVPPRTVINRNTAVELLTTFDEKERIIRSIGIKCVIGLDFTSALANLSSEEFFKEILIDKHNAREMVVGPNFTFGRAKEGGITTLKLLGAKHKVGLHVVKETKYRGRVISSSMIREFVKANKIKVVNRCLGRPYVVSGKIIKGRGLGKTIGFPTANLEIESGKLLPHGVFAGAVKVGKRNKILSAVCNIGYRPTFNQKGFSCEVYIIGYKGDIIGQNLWVELHQRLRAEKKFVTPELLSNQIKKDVLKARSLLKTLCCL